MVRSEIAFLKNASIQFLSLPFSYFSGLFSQPMSIMNEDFFPFFYPGTLDVPSYFVMTCGEFFLSKQSRVFFSPMFSL